MIELPSQLPAALALVLALRDDWVQREWLAALAWPHADSETAQHNLRVNLHRLRGLLAGFELGSALHQERRRLRLTLPSDLAEFRRALQASDFAAALQWHAGLAIQAFVLPAFPTLEDWFAEQRSALAQAGRDAALALARQHESAGRIGQAMRVLARQIDDDPLAEELVQLLLRLALQAGELVWARDVFERFRRRVRQELTLELLPATLMLAEALTTAAATGAEAAAAAGTVATEAPWVGRSEALRRVRAHPRRCTLVIGEGGCGKSRLLQQAGLQPAVWWRCRESAREEAFAPVVSWLAESGDLVRRWPHFVEHRRLLASLVPALADGESLPPAMVQRSRVVHVLAALLRDQAGLLVVDDLQWADVGTVAVLRTLTLRQRMPWIAAARPDELAPELTDWLDCLEREAALERIEIAPWTASEVEELLRRMDIASSAARSVGVWLHRHAGGHALFTLETLRDLRQRAGISDTAAGWTLAPAALDDTQVGTTPTVLRLVQRRVAALGGILTRVLALAALAGDARDIELLARVLELVPLDVAAALGDAQRAGLLRGRDFAHDLMREALRAGLPEAQRTAWHAALAEAAEAGEGDTEIGSERWPAARIADHWRAARRWVRWAEVSLQACTEERLRGLQGLAAERLDRLLAVELPAPWPARIAIERARCAWEADAREDAERWNDRALAMSPDAATQARALLLRSQMALKSGAVQAAQAWLEAAVQQVPPWPQWLEAAAGLAHQQGQFAEAERRYHELLAALRKIAPRTAADRDANAAAQAMALTNLGAAITAQGRAAESLPLHEQAMALARRRDARYLQLHIATNLLNPLMLLGRFDEAIAVGERALALGRYDGTSHLLNNLAAVLQAGGRWAEARRMAERLVDDADPTLHCAALARLLKLDALLGTSGSSAPLAFRLLQAMQSTDQYATQVMGVVALLDHGPSELHAQALTFLRDEGLSQRNQAVLDAALQRHAQARAAAPAD